MASALTVPLVRLGDKFIRAMRDRGLDVIDLREQFKAAGGPWYWSEYHINLKAQARIAETLLSRVRTRIAAR